MFRNTKGFTLIELLIVVTIIAVLSAIGYAVFSGLSTSGNDSRRRGDLKAISDALEAKKGTNSNYQLIKAGSFTGGVIPKEPTGRDEKYCYGEDNTPIDNPSVWTGSTCPVGIPTNIDNAATIGTNNFPYYKVCALNEKKDDVICFGSRQ